jgi:hypothetical protein
MLAGRAGRAAPPVDALGLVDEEAAVVGGGQEGDGTGISASTSAHISSLISRDGGRDAHDDMRRTLRRRVRTGQSPRTYFWKVFSESEVSALDRTDRWEARAALRDDLLGVLRRPRTTVRWNTPARPRPTAQASSSAVISSSVKIGTGFSGGAGSSVPSVRATSGSPSVTDHARMVSR